MTPLFINAKDSGGPEPYLLHVEAEIGPTYFKTPLRPPVTVQAPKGMTEQELHMYGLQRKLMLFHIEGMCKTARQVVTYDAEQFLKVMDAEVRRVGKDFWARPGIQFISLKEKAACMKEVPDNADLSIATASLFGAPQDNLQGIKALHEHKEIKTLLELV